jgi:ribosomal protein L37AE/L43A
VLSQDGKLAGRLPYLFTPDNCVLHITRVAQIVRDNRKMFLHKKCWHTFKGYAYQQVKKMTSQEYDHCPKCKGSAATWEDVLQNHDTEAFIVKVDMTREIEADVRDGKQCAKCGSMTVKKKVKRKGSKRQESVEKYGYDVKFAYHVVRLLNEVEQIMMEGDLDLMRNREQLKSIRRGEWKEEDIRDYFTKKEKELETLYEKSTLPWGPDEGKIKQLLLHCLEEHYGNLEKCVVNVDEAVETLRELAAVLDKHRKCYE